MPSSPKKNNNKRGPSPKKRNVAKLNYAFLAMAIKSPGPGKNFFTGKFKNAWKTWKKNL